MLQIFVHFAKRSKIFFGINNNYFGGKQHACADLTSVQNWFASAGWAATLSDQRQEEKAMRVTGAPSAAYMCGLVCAMGAVAARQWGGMFVMLTRGGRAWVFCAIGVLQKRSFLFQRYRRLFGTVRGLATFVFVLVYIHLRH